MGVAAAALGLPAEFVSPLNRTYKVSPWSFEIQGAFESYLEQKVVAAARRQRPYLSPEEYDKSLKDVIADVGLGLYTFGSEKGGLALGVPENVQHMFWLCVNFYHREVMIEDVKSWAKTHYGEMVQAMNRANADPNLQGEKASSSPSPISSPASPAPTPASV